MQMLTLTGNVGTLLNANSSISLSYALVRLHSFRHFEITSHTFTMQIGGGRVWDYAGDNYVHRLIQNSTDGKMVEFQNGATNNAEVE